jgi:hypothetical protein
LVWGDRIKVEPINKLNFRRFAYRPGQYSFQEEYVQGIVQSCLEELKNSVREEVSQLEEEIRNCTNPNELVYHTAQLEYIKQKFEV